MNQLGLVGSGAMLRNALVSAVLKKLFEASFDLRRKN